MNYVVEIGQTGRGGTIMYRDQGSVLSFHWEFAINGADMFVPTPEEWDGYCRSCGADWAQGKRQEILQRVVDEVRKQKAAGSIVTIEENWVHFAF